MKRNKVVELVTDPTKNFLTFFVVGTLLFTIVSDGVSFLFWDVLGEWLRSQLGLEPGWFRAGVILLLIVLLLTVIYGTNFSRWLRGWLAKVPLLGIKVAEEAIVTPLTDTYLGLIVTMSLKPVDSPAEVAIRHHWNQGQAPHLQHCWLICTEGSLPFVKELEKRFADEGLTQVVEFHYGDRYTVEDVDHPDQRLSLLVPDQLLDNPEHIRRLVNGIYADAEQKGLAESELIADYTGGPKGTTAGILLACATPERRLQYISQVVSPRMQAINVAYKIRPARSG